MNTKEEWIAILIIIASITLGWFFRYDFQIVNPGGQGAGAAGYMLNRWTGTVYFVMPSGIRELREVAQTP